METPDLETLEDLRRMREAEANDPEDAEADDGDGE